MKYLIGLSFLVFMSISVFAQNVELSNKLIQKFETAQAKALSKDAASHHRMWLTPILTEVVINWNNLTPEAKDFFNVYRNRPVFNGTVLTISDDNFTYHYTLDGGPGESVDPTDENTNGIPDYVEMMSEQFHIVYMMYHTATGLTVPPSDGTMGGDDKYDIYISGDAAGAGVYGWVMAETEVGDNPNSTTLTEVDAYSSFMVMRNNYAGFGDETVSLNVTAAHEYMHAIQNGYAISMEAWFKEICATWSEEFVFPGSDDNFQYLMGLFGKPDVALNLMDGEEPSLNGHWYSSWIFAKYLTEQTGNGIIKNIYERCINEYAVDAINTELSTNWETNFETMFIKFSIANVLMTNDANFVPYAYDRAADYDTYIMNNGGFGFENNLSPINYTGTPISWNSQTDGNDQLMRLSADYFKFTTNSDFSIAFNANTNQAKLILVKGTANSVSYAMCNANDVQDIEALNYTLTFDDASTGINEMSSNISVFPNPASDFVMVNFDNSNKYDVSLIDITGKKIIRQESNNQNCKIDVRNINDGIYFLQIMQNNVVVKTQKIVISH